MKKLLFSVLLLMGYTVGAMAQGNFFEGTIKYRTYESHSKVVLKFSAGQAYNGARNTKTVLKGTKAISYDESLNMYTIFDPERSKITAVFNEIQEAMEFDFDKYTSTYSAYSSARATYTTEPTDETVELLGHTCRKHLITLKPKPINGVQANTVTKIECWITDDYDIYKNYWYAFLYGLELPGITLKYTVDSKGSVPIFGKMSSYVASKVVSIEEGNVSDDLFKVPDGYKLSISESPFKYLKLIKKNIKALKAAKKYPTMAVDESVTFNVDEEWDF